MAENPKLLVVDDEEVICKACRRIFSRQGFAVDTFTDAREGLKYATEHPYVIILLDIKMPNLDGIQFLEKLREKSPEVPVLIMTGYPSIPNAAAAMRLGASDYVTKPFSPEEITRAVQRVVSQTEAARAEDVAVLETQETADPEELLFFDETWFRIERDGSACVGAVLPGLRGTTIKSLRLPRIGEVVCQGLPLASLTTADRPVVAIPSPVSGVVAGINEILPRNPSLLLSDPCGDGWLACVCTTRFEEEAGNCKVRRVVLAHADKPRAEKQRQRLQSLGCQVRMVASADQLAAAVSEPDHAVLLLDAASFGAQGPELVKQVNLQMPSVKVVVMAEAQDQREAAYRKSRILYYAVEPFADHEI
ncbi:MAG: response regulator, partial [Pirellulales bacterium]